MEGIRQYVLSVIAVAVVCSIAKRISGSKSNSIVNTICGLFLAVTVLAPLITFDYTSMELLSADFSNEAQYIVDQSEVAVEKSVASIITEQTQAYILDKANVLALDIDVDVVLDNNHVPTEVTLYGDVSPYQKSVLSHYIEQTLAIPEECQTWM